MESSSLYFLNIFLKGLLLANSEEVSSSEFNFDSFENTDFVIYENLIESKSENNSKLSDSQLVSSEYVKNSDAIRILSFFALFIFISAFINVKIVNAENFNDKNDNKPTRSWNTWTKETYVALKDRMNNVYDFVSRNKEKVLVATTSALASLMLLFWLVSYQRTLTKMPTFDVIVKEKIDNENGENSSYSDQESKSLPPDPVESETNSPALSNKFTDEELGRAPVEEDTLWTHARLKEIFKESFEKQGKPKFPD